MVACAEEPKPERKYSVTQAAQLLEDQAEASALGASVVLTELREGRTNSVLESLGFQIDAAVVAAWHRAQTGTDDQKTKAMD